MNLHRIRTTFINHWIIFYRFFLCPFSFVFVHFLDALSFSWWDVLAFSFDFFNDFFSLTNKATERQRHPKKKENKIKEEALFFPPLESPRICSGASSLFVFSPPQNSVQNSVQFVERK